MNSGKNTEQTGQRRKLNDFAVYVTTELVIYNAIFARVSRTKQCSGLCENLLCS